MKTWTRKISPRDLIHLSSVVLQHRRNHSVTFPHVMQKKIGIWIEGFATQCFGNGIRASIELCACWCGGQSTHVALGASNLVKKLRTFLRLVGVRQLRIAGGRFGGADETSKTVNIVQTVRTGHIVWLSSAVAKLSYLVREQAGGDAHFI